MKYNVCHDELEIKNKSGLYTVYPYERLNKNKGVFKVGRTSQDFSARLEQFHSYFPLGVYIVMFLQYPRIKRGQNKEELHREMEKKLFENIQKEKGKMLLFPSRPSQRSEWFYASFEQIRKAYLKLQEEYGGVLSEYDLSHLDEIYEKSMKRKNKFVGEIIYKV